MSRPQRGRVAITPRGLRIDGRTRLLYGGEVQYYRIRDPLGDIETTQAMWAATLDRVASIGNLVTAYVPWDWHERREGHFDFSGIRDLDRFLELCHERSLLVVIKPGPFINSEWPRGIGSFGAVPNWFRARHVDCLARTPSGELFSTDPLGRPFGYQPSFFAPVFRAAVKEWFAALAPTILHWIERKTIFSLQIDNETNFYFGCRYSVDYSLPALKSYRAFLRERYGSIETLNLAYGSEFPDFQRVAPPTAAPRREADPIESRRHHDWFEAGQAGIAEYQRYLRAAWEDLGVCEPEILFATNDSPHAFPGRELTLWDGPRKNVAGVAMLDAYPRQFPTSGSKPTDYPWLTAYFSKRFRSSNDSYAFAGEPPTRAGKCYGAELEGGLFELPLLKRPLPVPSETTAHVLLQHLGRGSALAGVYILRAGINADHTPYFGNAALDGAGRPTERWRVVERFGRLIREHGSSLLASQELRSDVALLVDGGRLAPAASPIHPGRLQVEEGASVFGWWEAAGYDLPVFEVNGLRPGELDPYRLVVFVNPGAVSDELAELLLRYTRGGGHLLNLCGRGERSGDWGLASPAAKTLFGGGAPWHTFRRAPWRPLRIQIAWKDLRGPLAVGPALTTYKLEAGVEPLAYARGRLGFKGEPAGWIAARGAGWFAHLGASPAELFRTGGYYTAPQGELTRAIAFARRLAKRAGCGLPPVRVTAAEGSAWARRVDADQGGGAFLFVAGRRDRPQTLQIRLELDALGLRADDLLRIEDTLTGAVLSEARPADTLLLDPLEVRLPHYGTAVWRLTPARR
ncbi:MAG: beta-galactosidase [Planctomycetes bacterium]|nr:beta-galactosidase [Planctomycetota bacterium]